MFFADHEKLIYKPDWVGESGNGYDPLRLERLLVYHSGGKVYEWMDAVNADRRPPGALDEGDVSADGKRQKAAAAAGAELELPRVARAAFGFEESVLDAVVLERLYEFLEYIAGKGQTAGTPQEWPESSPTPSESTPTNSG